MFCIFPMCFGLAALAASDAVGLTHITGAGKVAYPAFHIIAVLRCLSQTVYSLSMPRVYTSKIK